LILVVSLRLTAPPQQSSAPHDFLPLPSSANGRDPFFYQQVDL
jgi:hypothetical protein